MRTRGLAVLGVALLVVMAGCAGMPGGPATSADGPNADGGTSTAPDGDAAASSGFVNFYVSDERNAIGDFRHLNVTITAVGFHQVDDGNESENETDDANETTVVMTTEAPSTTATDGGTTTADANGTTAAAAGGAGAQANGTTTDANATTADAASTTAADEEADDGEPGPRNAGGWVTHEVDNVTIDLTQYQGANATLLDRFEVPDGTYNKVFVYVSDVNGTLNESGEQVNVKLPSERLHINKEFTVGANESVDFVYDITVFKAGQSGKYILKPVVSESGTDVPIEAEERGQEGGPPEDAGAPDDPGADDAGEGDDADGNLTAAIQGQVAANETVTLSVTGDGGPVANASVTVNSEAAGETGADGTLEITVPDAEELEVVVTHGDLEVELEREIV